MEEILIEILETLKSERPKKITFTIAEAANYSGIGQVKIRELINKPNTDFPFFKVGARALIDKAALDNWMEKITQEHRGL
ncbi:excisionase family DNA binding protein [Clostridium saccharoperbutylacetonicum]|uniref:Excisionase family n=1 Tax=Clostridium saccharoperbutylacetonicum N1-4(HMT) TaxID=931276 RepID=M1MES4_9CLOT|nr:excisionase [Clostridium saccharoperbutylacetonicum]AGF56419.1 excisionase family [Clostridium saccharoperbutylacetonicum N1-4(HMT)]NRT62837.1 excisionase family DNA binding protein [Clostridium saccharoperbutylacetonicum]NSB26192.1 excisionase family DNA binding protein [Clostridium saccharoperbutylacetonicum]NSB45545.1 excisionase family DNA binding protein [Clostridium saccharoperbutylacetonicum]